MTPDEMRVFLRDRGAHIEFFERQEPWCIYADLPENIKLRARGAGLQWGYGEDFDRWANSVDVETPLPRNEEQLGEMIRYLAENRFTRRFVAYREARKWCKKQKVAA